MILAVVRECSGDIAGEIVEFETIEEALKDIQRDYDTRDFEEIFLYEVTAKKRVAAQLVIASEEKQSSPKEAPASPVKEKKKKVKNRLSAILNDNSPHKA